MNYPSTNITGLDNQDLELKLQQRDVLKDVLKDTANSKVSGCLRISCNSIIYFVYLNQGKLIYGTNSLAPFERLERHLRRLSNNNSKLTNEVIKQARSKFKPNLQQYQELPSDYQGIFWLLEEKYINKEETLTLIRRITREVFESLLILPKEFKTKFVNASLLVPEICQFELISFLEQCQQRLQAWQAFAPEISSSYQRLYLVRECNNLIANFSSKQNETICKLLTGLNFRQLSAVIDQDELIVVKILYTAITNGNILIRNPKEPFAQLPNFPEINAFVEPIEDWQVFEIEGLHNSNSKETIQLLEKHWKLAFIDDNIKIHEQVKEFLDNNLFSVSFINDPLKALAELIDFKPDLILLDLNMPELSGYELCGLLKNNQILKNVPIVMLLDNQGLINTTKAKIVGAIDYLNKPFTQSDLFNVIFKYLS
jgi:twitching motility two-component system response regulator PilG